MYRTPAKDAPTRDLESQQTTVTAGSVAGMAGPSRTSVRRSIGEWESGKSDSRGSLSPPNKTFTVGPPKPKPVAARKLSVEAAGSPPKQRTSKTTDRVAEAKACVLKAKLNLTNSRNLKTDIKQAVTQAIDRLFQLVKEADSAKRQTSDTQQQVREQDGTFGESVSSSPASVSCLEEAMKIHIDLLKENTARVKTLTEALQLGTVAGGHNDMQTENFGQLLGEVRELRRTTEETERKVSSLQETVPSYAEVLARPNCTTITPTRLRPKHSIIVSSSNDLDTSDEVLGKVRDALEAKTTGLQLTRVQKVRNQKVVLSCSSKEEIQKVAHKISAKGRNLKVEEARNKDPLVIIKNILSFHKDEEVVACLKSQNADLFRELSEEDSRAVVRYRRKARNPHENHVVLQVSPKLWHKLTVAKRVHVDLQYAAVQDQSPLVQCTRCLGYGHGRRLCTESADLCSYCAGPHLRANCPAYVTGDTATCRNCRSAKYAELGHNAFDPECPVRKRWDAIARSSVAYC